jgi:hypothetical protein
VQVFSDTHPIQENWYNNNSPIFSWIKDPGVTGFSYSIDNMPSTIPDSVVDSEDTTKGYENLGDGLWYFHIKALKNGVWGATGNFLVRIDTTPPAEFKPEVDYLFASVVSVERSLVSFFTTDNLSGIDHYEVGVIDMNQPPTVSPVFVESSSPYQVPIKSGDKLQVIVRAIDKAGNIRDESINVTVPNMLSNFIKIYLSNILAGIILLILIISLTYYILGHHIVRHLKRMAQAIKKEEAEETLAQEVKEPDKPA